MTSQSSVLSPGPLPVKTASPGLSVAVDECSEADWNQILSLFEDASLYQTWAYGAVSWGGKQLSHLILKQGDAVVAAAQVRVMQVPLLRAGVAYVRWGPLWRRRGVPLDTSILEAAVKALIRVYAKERGLLLRIIPPSFREDPLSGEILGIWTRCGFTAQGSPPPYHTICVDLTPPPEEIRKRLDQKWRNQLNGAERNGLTILSGTGEQLFERFLNVYDEMMRRKQFDTTVDPREFAAMQHRLPPDQKMLILLAEKDGEVMSGLISTSIGGMGIYLHGATSDPGMKSKGSYLLQWRMMNLLKEAGCRSYDLGGINPDGNPGVYHFKQGFGGTECRQLGRLTHRGGVISTASVTVAERLQKSWKRARSALRRSPSPNSPA